MIDTVLIPVDGSDASLKAARFGSDLAKHYGARVILLHVLLHQNLAEALHGLTRGEREGTGAGLTGLASALDQEALDGLLADGPGSAPPSYSVLEFIAERVIATAEKAVRVRGVNDVQTVVEQGDPAKRILELAEKENADMIVMGARGLSAEETLLLGSVSQKVSHLSTRTCITVR